jgi:hypothetical protein
MTRGERTRVGFSIGEEAHKFGVNLEEEKILFYSKFTGNFCALILSPNLQGDKMRHFILTRFNGKEATKYCKIKNW